MSRAPAEIGSAANSYEILSQLAIGGMAEIFLARAASGAGVERYVVLKRVLRERATDVMFVRMFLDEARLAAQLQHPNIAQVYDVGKLGDSYFFTMEYVHGETVRALLHRSHALRRPIPISCVLTIAAGSAAGLHHAHERNGLDGRPLGIVHRDVSPSNLMVSYEGTVKVVDFGVAKAAHRSQETQSGAVKGKISYLSPEQARGQDIDRRSDLFSLGIVLWEMLTTERLFKRGSDFENMNAIISEPIPPPSTRRADVTPDLDAVVLKLLAKSAVDRYQTAEEVHEVLEAVSMRAGAALSTPALGRFVRELFGQRPEPWIEMAANEAHPQAYTVTSEPIPPDYGTPSSMPAVGMREQLPTARGFLVPEPAATTSLPPGDPDVALDLLETQREMRRHAPSASPRPVTATVASPTMTPEPELLRRSRAGLWTVVVLGVLGLGGVAAYVVTSGSAPGDEPGVRVAGDEARAHPPGDVTTASAAPAVEASLPDAAAEAEPAVDAGRVALAVDAGAKATVVPIAPKAGPHPGGRPRHLRLPVEDTEPSPVLLPDNPPTPSPAVTLDRQFAAGEYAEAVATCAANPTLASVRAAVCALAACHVGDATRARIWAQGAGSMRPSVLSTCRAARIELDPFAASHPKPEAVDCKADPLACQH